jgi:hypothetical protein
MVSLSVVNFVGNRGILLKIVRDRSYFGKWIAAILGYFWKLGTYFVMPLLALESLSAGEALHRSASLIRWGETSVAGFSFPLLFSILSVPGLALFFGAGILGQSFELAAIVSIAYWLLLAVFVFSTEQVFTAALYLYAKEDTVPKSFMRADMKAAWGKRQYHLLGVNSEHLRLPEPDASARVRFRVPAMATATAFQKPSAEPRLKAARRPAI